MSMTHQEIEELLLGLKAAVRRMQERGMKVDGTGSSAYFPLPIGLGVNGGIYQGTGTFATPTTGLKIWNDAGVGRIGGYNAGVIQWYANTDGKLYMGGGKVIGDTDGLSFDLTGLAGTDYQNYLKFKLNGVRVAQLYAFHDPTTDTRIGVSVHNEGIVNYAFFNAVSEATYRAHAELQAFSGTVHERINIDADSDGNSAIIIGDQGHFGTRFGNAAVYPAANDVYVTQSISSAAGTNVETYKMLDGTTTKSSLKWVGDVITWDIPSVEPTNKITNGTFDTDLSGWVEYEDWWLAGSIDPANAIAAYQAKGAANLADSYINRANPGTYDLTVVAGKTAPGWDAVNGWNFYDTSDTNTLNTGITLDSLNWSVLAKFSGVGGTTRWLVYSYTNHLYFDPSYFALRLHRNNESGLFYSCSSTPLTVNLVSNINGVAGMAATHAYWNGAEQAEHILQTVYPTETIKIGQQAQYIQSVSFYDTPITPAQVAAVTDAMNAMSGAERDTAVKYAGVASAKIIAALDKTFLFSVNVGNTSTYTLTCYAYTTGAAVATADLDLWYDGAELTTTFADMGSGWYKLTGTLTGVASAKDYGVRVHAGKTAYVDSFTLQAGAGNNTTLSFLNSGTGILHPTVEGTTTLNAGIATEQALIVKGFAGQTANLAEFQQSDGTIVASVTNDVYITNDLRVGSGLYVGSLGTDPGADNIVADGTITATGGFVGAINNSLLTEQGDIIYASAASTPAALAHGTAGQVLQSGGNAANPSWLTLAVANISDFLSGSHAFTGQPTITSASFPVLHVVRTSAGTNTALSTLKVTQKTTDTMADGFGVGIQFSAQDVDADNPLAYILAKRLGADNTGELHLNPVYGGLSAIIAMKLTSNTLTLADVMTIVTGTTTGLKIGGATNQKLGFFNAAPVVQQAHIADPSGGAVVDTEARAAIALLTALMETYGFTATS